MLLTLSKKSAMYTTTLCVVLLQTLTMTHMLPMSAPIRTAEELNQMIDPVFQSEQDENQLESKKIVAKSVYNTVIRVTTTPCQSGMQRVKEGGPCVTRYTGSGPVFDEEFQLSILKGITGGGRRPTSSKHRNRHRTTTTPIPSTTTAIETAAPTTWGLPPTAAENVENEESRPQSNGDVKKVGNVEMLDIEVDTTKTQEPQIHPDMTVMPASSISSPSMSVPIPTPQQGPRPLPTPTMMTPAPPASTNNGSSENVTAETEVLKLEDPVETLSPGKIGSIIASNMTTFLPPQNLGIKDDNDEEQTTETSTDFSTTMISIMREDEIINFDDGTNTTQELEEQVIDATTETTTLPSSLMTTMGQSVTANETGEEEDKVVNNIHPDTFDPISNSSIIVTKPQNETEPDQIAWPESGSGVNASHPQPSNSTLTVVTSDTPVTIIIPLLVPQLISNTKIQTPHNFTESENDTRMTDGNTRLPDLNGAQNTGHHVQKTSSSPEGDLASTFITSPTAAAKDDEMEEGLSNVPTSPQPHQLIQINDFEMDPLRKDDPTPAVMMMEDTDVKVENIFKTKPQDELFTRPNLDKITSSSSSVEEILSTAIPSSPPMSLAQEILSRLKPISQSLLRFHQSTETPPSTSSPSLPFRRGDISPELILMREIDPDFPSSSEFGEEEIDQSHHRSRSRNRARSSEVLDISSQARAMPSNTRSDEIEDVVPVAHFQKMLFTPAETVDYTRLGDKYRRFRVF